MSFSGTSPDGKLVEVVELPAHPWFVAVQFHPEFKSKPTQAHPLFRGFVKAALDAVREKRLRPPRGRGRRRWRRREEGGFRNPHLPVGAPLRYNSYNVRR